MRIQVGEALPDCELMRWTGSEMLRRSSRDLMGSGRCMIVGTVGAFTPVCTRSHLADYLPVIPTLRQAGSIDRFYCIGVVDPFVFQAWGAQLDAHETIEMWADPFAAFSRAIDITADLTKAGLGLRSGRYSMVTFDGRVERLNVEEDPTIVSVSGVETLRRQLAS